MWTCRRRWYSWVDSLARHLGFGVSALLCVWFTLTAQQSYRWMHRNTVSALRTVTLPSAKVKTLPALLSHYWCSVSCSSQRCNWFHSSWDTLGCVLVRLDCYNKIPYTGGLDTAEIYFAQSWILGNPRWRRGQIWCLMKALFLVHGQLSTPGPHRAEEGRELSGTCFVRSLNPFMRASPLWPHHFSRAPPLNTKGIRFQSKNVEDHEHSV